MSDHADTVIARFGNAQHGRVSRAQLLTASVGPEAIRQRLRSGHLHPAARAVYAIGHRAPSRYGELMTAVLAAGPGAVLSHASAAALHALIDPPASPHHVTRPGGSARSGDVQVHRAKLPASEVTLVQGISVTTVPRTLLDLAETAPPHLLTRALGEAEVLGLTTRLALVASMESWHGRRGLKALRAVLAGDLQALPTRSVLEDRFAAIVRASQLPRPRYNAHVFGAQVDAYWPDHRVIVELDGRRYHDTDSRFETDRARDARLIAGGFAVLHFTWRRLREAPYAVVAELTATLIGRRPAT